MSDIMELNIEMLEKRGINRYKAVLMAAEEARLINDQVRLGIIEPTDKPSSMALQRLYEGRVVEEEEATPES
jgi:DNA-directed RNA polymerase subunit K/omega